MNGRPADGHEAASIGVLVVGHGTASGIGAGECGRVAEMAASLLPGLPLELGFLEVIEPSIETAMQRLVGRGAREVVVAPLLLFAAGHARRDVPDAVRVAAESLGMAVRQADVLGCHPAIVELARRRYAEAVATLGATPAADRPAEVVVVGRGSSDPSAAEQLSAFASLVFEESSGARAATPFRLGFVAAARPGLDEAIAAAVAERPDRVVVHPHLLFHGHVESQVAERVARARHDHPGIAWSVAARLGAEPAVARALVDRIRASIGPVAADGRPVFGGVLSKGFGIA